ncbi:MAG TPA: hypothetical protein VNU01_07505 [Egibacteraceae bacterium]|nr:hypothetical protein [Egibacteraceae bacterium]
MLVSALVGALSLGAAWAGAVLTPARTAGPDVGELPEQAGGPFRASPSPSPTPDPLPGLQGGEVYAGAAKVNIAPRPGPDDVWIRDQAACETLTAPDRWVEHVQDLHTLWPENPGCIYTGGYGIGPANAVSEFDTEYGLWARSVALGDGTETVVLTVVDGVYWQGRYGKMCDGCGAFDLAEQLSAELAAHGVKRSGLFFAATHSHTAPDFIGGWGGVPKWYMEQVAEAMRDSVRQAVASLRPATVEAGEILARDHNKDRRTTYYSAEEAGMSWLRAVGRDGEVVATLGAYAAHPTTSDEEIGVAHADWPGLYTKRLEDRFGGVGLHFMTGLGQMTARGGRNVGVTLADLVPEVGRGQAVGSPDAKPAVRSAAAMWDQPITNGVLAALGGAGLFDRPFGGPAQVSAGRSAQRPCVSAAPISVNTGVNAARVGNLVFTGAPGETFANLSNSIKERRTGQVTFPLALVNDGLGYIMQSIETFDEARQGLGFAGSDATEYEDAYSIDRCFGDKVLDESIRLVESVWGS